MATLLPANVKNIIIHITDSYYGTVEIVDKWHKDRGWNEIGYHYLITNCFRTHLDWDLKTPAIHSDGVIHEGRPKDVVGAHAKGNNYKSIGVALVGKGGAFTSKQLHSARDLCLDLLTEFPIEKILGHYEVTNQKTCPDIDMDRFRKFILAPGGNIP